MPTERRLAAIMFTDIVGYTALMAESEERGLRAKEQHRTLVRPLVERYYGAWIDSPGRVNAIESAMIGDKEQAMTGLERAYEERDPLLLLANVEPLLDPLRSDPRFQDLLRRIGFPESPDAP